MKDYLKERILNEAMYIIRTKDTVRGTGKRFLVSKSTVHKDLTERLEKINYSLYLEVREVLDTNKVERAIRGGYATRDKYLALKKNKNK